VAHGEQYKGRVRATQGKTFKKPENMRFLTFRLAAKARRPMTAAFSAGVCRPRDVALPPPHPGEMRRFTGYVILAGHNFAKGLHMAKWKELEKQFAARLSMSRRPVAVTFLDAEPASIPRFTGTEPSGCSFWRLAADGRVFYTLPADHFNCAVGAYTLNVQLPPERAQETENTFGMMFDLGYLRREEVPGIPRLHHEPAAIVYAPLADAPVTPGVVLFACRASSAMLLQEAAIRAGAGAALPVLGRPTCMALPSALLHGTVASLGCIGNRVYTDLGADELYIAVPGSKLESVAEALGIINSANAALEEYARGRRASLSTI
jgi:uncharacterized protein (DUF169 family)